MSIAPRLEGLPAEMAGEGLQILTGLETPVREILVNSTPRVSQGKGGTWKVRLADGRSVKLRWLPSLARARSLALLDSVTRHLPLAKTFVRQGQFVVEEWIEGSSLATFDLREGQAELLGDLMGRIAATLPPADWPDARLRSDEALVEKCGSALEMLREAGCLTATEADRLRHRLVANRPGAVEVGLTHLDVKPENVVVTETGLQLIDNELLDVGPLDQDLARFWSLWPLSSPQRNRFQHAYERHRSLTAFLLHEPFWAIQALAGTLAWQLPEWQTRPGLVAGLKRLAAGELPRNWSSPPCGPSVPPSAGTADIRLTRRVKLAFLCDYLAIGGQERICLEMIRGLDRSRFEPFLYAFRGGALEPEFRKLGIPMVIGSTRDPLLAASRWTVEDAREKLAYRGSLAAALRRDAIDAALVFAWRDAIPALQQAGVRVAIEKLDGPSLIGKVVDKSGYDRVVAESGTIRASLLTRLAEFGMSADQVEFIYPGIDLARFDPDVEDRGARRAELGIPPDDFVVGTVSRLITDKNIKLLVKAFAAMAPSPVGRTARLLICGPDGGALGELREVVRALGIAPLTHFVPPTTHVAGVLATLDVFGMTSLREGLPTALLEAMAMGLPIVTTGVGSIPEVMQENGFLLPGYGAEGIGQRLARLRDDRDLCRSQGERSRSIASRFASRHSVGRYEELVLECLAGKPAAPVPLPPGANWPANDRGDARPGVPRVLALLDGLEESQRDLMPALAGQAELEFAWLRRPSVKRAVRPVGLPRVGPLKPRAEINVESQDDLEVFLGRHLEQFRPDILYLAPTPDESLVARLRQWLDSLAVQRRPRLVRSMRAFHCRDSQETLGTTGHVLATHPSAVVCDGLIFESQALLANQCAAPGFIAGRGPCPTLVVPTSQSLAHVASPSAKWSAEDGRLHLALLGRLSKGAPKVDRLLANIEELCRAGFIVHSFFEGEPPALERVQILSQKLPEFHPEAALDPRQEVLLSQALSKCDLLGLFAPIGTGDSLAAFGIPEPAVQAWLLGGIPVVCERRQRGLSEWIESLGWGFVVDEVADAAQLLDRRSEIAAATRACLAHRTLLSAESQAVRLARFCRSLAAQGESHLSQEVTQQ